MKLSSEKQQLVLKNQKLVFYLVNRLGIAPNSADYEDIVSIGTIGLIKAACTFDESKKNTFATYASRCINNEIFMHYRKANKCSKEISIDEPIGRDGEGEEISFGEILEHSDSNFLERMVTQEDFKTFISIVLNSLEEKKRLVMLYRVANIKQIEIGKILKISRSYVSRIEERTVKNIKNLMTLPKGYKEVFSVDIRGNTYVISFSSKDVINFNESFARVLMDLKWEEDLIDFEISYNKESVMIEVPADSDSFLFIAKIIQEIDDVTFS